MLTMAAVNTQYSADAGKNAGPDLLACATKLNRLSPVK